MLVKTSIVCLLLIIYMMAFYYCKPHIPIKSTRLFQWLAQVALLVTIFDLITLYTVNHRDTVSADVNLIVHIIYLMSLLGFIYLLFLYMRSYLEAGKRFGRMIRVMQALPFILSAVGILILPITYVHGRTTDYSLGPKAYALYVSVVIYLLLILYYCLRYWEELAAEKRMAILLAVPLYAITAAIQLAVPESLVVVVCVTLIMMGLILSNENIEKYMDEKTAMFNQYSFETVLDEFDFQKQQMIIGILCFSKIESSYDWKQNVIILKDIHKELRLQRLECYRVCENGAVFIASSYDRARMVLDKVKNNMESKYADEGISIETRVFCGKNCSSKHDCMQNITAFCTEIGRRFAYIDYLTHIYNRNALERDIANLRDDKGYYLIADLNDLKLVNDTIGHSAGDELLQSFAALLVAVVQKNGKVYRQGGDEFAILYYGDVHKLLYDLEKECRVRNQSRNIPTSYAIGYCELSQENFIDNADKMMYADKRKKKGRLGEDFN
ncbi:MAG: GGDEF domain-containing protein [Lachnospira sp.]|nr:GGDEF domain-containing protein [Lachnospira sp.]